METFLGIDCGSVSMKAVVIDSRDRVVASCYTKNHGLVDTIRTVLSCIRSENPVNGVGITGSGRELISLLAGGDLIESEIIAHYVAATHRYPDVRTILDIGGEDSKLMITDNGTLTSFSMNRDCGGGTGAMIESIAHRMGIPLEKIGETALRSRTKVSIPGKCGIFAQSSVVSKLNRGVPVEDILMGVCRGLAGNFFTMLAKGIRLKPPYVFQGATANNRALVKCIEEELRDTVIIPEHPELMGALGMALLVREERRDASRFRGYDLENRSIETRVHYGRGCTNECEITVIYDQGVRTGYIGNRCERCITAIP